MAMTGRAKTLSLAAIVLASTEAWARGEPVFSVGDVIGELSGAVLDARRGVVWSIGDSGNGAVLGKTSLVDWTTRALAVTGTRNFDWEAIALDDQGDLWVFDVGDNEERRPSVFAVRIAPELERDGEVRPLEIVPIRYAGGPRNVEAVVVTHGRAYLFEKSYLYRARIAVADLRSLDPVAIDSGWLPPGVGPITDASITDRDSLYLLTYLGVLRCNACLEPGLHWPATVRSGFRGQVEALIAYAEDRFWVGNESGAFYPW